VAWSIVLVDKKKTPCHTARSIKVWMEDHQIKTLSWPAQSPALNPIEILCCDGMKMDGHKPINMKGVFCKYML